MGYSQEYKDWTGEDVEASFTIEEISSQVMPGQEREFSCDGIGFIALLKDEDGVLSVKMAPVGTEDSEIIQFYDIIERYKPTFDQV